ncbi:MAG: LLM class flavin-dependent oxidoreductase [Defluviitaleaceae bacterium]|nr:LLM class flavin-dependent oxidoreductase [Defluviitaleaceae bacterium]
MEIGISTFVETTPYENGEIISHAQRIQEVIEEIVLADELGLDVYGIGEHHREDFAASSPAIILAGAATRTKNIRLTSAVTVLSSIDPVRVFQDFASLDALSNGRAEIMVGRGSFTESFPLFGYSLEHYSELFEEKLELLLQIQKSEKVTWSGKHRAAINNLGIYPRPIQKPLPIWIGSGGNAQSAVRPALLGLPLVLAIIGGNPEHFKPVVELYRRAAMEAKQDLNKMKVATHSHGFVADTDEEALEKFYFSTHHVMSKLGRERGWLPYTRETYNMATSPDGALFVGSPKTVAEKIIKLKKNLNIDRFFMHTPVGTMYHKDVMKSIELLAKEVVPIVRNGI